MPAIIFAHPRSEVKLQDPRDPPVTDGSILKAIKASHAELQQTVKALAHQPYEEQWERLDGIEATRRICERFGYARVSTWVRNLAAISGESI